MPGIKEGRTGPVNFERGNLEAMEKRLRQDGGEGPMIFEKDQVDDLHQQLLCTITSAPLFEPYEKVRSLRTTNGELGTGLDTLAV
jgi:hypothetical protein